MSNKITFVSTKWVKADVLFVTKRKILLKLEDGEIKWINKEKIKKILPRKIMCYVTLPSQGSRHFGNSYQGFCIER